MDEVARVLVRDRLCRHARPGAPAFPSRDDCPDNRWQRGDVVDALYLAADEATAWAEWYRFLAEWALPPARHLPRDLWWYRVALEVADLSDESKLAAVDLPLPRPTRRQWPQFQAVGEQLYREGYRGVLCPSAARRASTVLCVFLPRGTTTVAGVTPLAPPTRVSEPPVPPRGMRT